MYNNIPFKIIAAVDKNFGIGFKDELLVTDKDDMREFQQQTSFNIVVMGMTTFESLGCVPLKNRINIVITSNKKIYNEHEPSDKVVYAHSIDEAMNLANAFRTRQAHSLKKTIWVIGGGSIYYQLIDYADEIKLSCFKEAFTEVDTYFPPIKEEIFFNQYIRHLNGKCIVKTYLRRKND